MKKVIAKKEKSEYSIVIPNDAHLIEKTASEELASYLEKSLSVSLPIVFEREASGKCIYVGHTEFAKNENVIGKSKENWIINMVSDNLVLTGGVATGDRGIIYSVYHFLEDIVGVRWWSPCEEDIPSLSELSIEKDTYLEGTPAFEYRKPYLNRGRGVSGLRHMARVRVNAISPLDDKISENYTDADVRKYGDFLHAGRPHHAHTMRLLCPVDEYYEEHPEWWAWNKVRGEHIKSGQPCFLNDEFFEMIKNKLLSYIEEDIRASKTEGVEFPSYYAIFPNDVGEEYFCQCEKCEKLIKKAGLSGYIIDLANRIVREINKVYPFVKIKVPAYADYMEIPKDDTVADKNVIIELCNLSEDIARGVNAPTNKLYQRLLEDWSAFCKKGGNQLMVWKYLYNMRLGYPIPIFDGLSDTMRMFREKGVTGVFVETQQHHQDVWELNKYVLTHLLEDPYADAEALVCDFTNRYYGKAAECIRRYFGVLKSALERNVIHVYCDKEDSPFNYIDSTAVIEGSKYLEEAMKLTENEYPFYGRVLWVRKFLDTTILLKYFDLLHQASRNGEKFDFDRAEAKKRILAALDYFYSLDINEIYREAKWERHFFENFVIEEEKELTLPKELEGINPHDVYKFPMRNMVRFAHPIYVDIYGHSIIKDRGAIEDTVMRISGDDSTDAVWDLGMTPTSKYREEKSPIRFSIYQNEELVSGIELYREDLNTEEYKLYKIGSVTLKNQPNTQLSLFSRGNINVNLSGISATFPADTCDVYLSMKFSGEKYGGKASSGNAIFFDSMIVVRKR